VAQPTAAQIIAATVAVMGSTPEDIRGPCRKLVHARPRNVVMYLMRELTDQSMQSISGVFGCKSRSSVLRANIKVTKIMSQAGRTRDQVDQIMLAVGRNIDAD
jgi:chromosomal replication initiation ATPase DnaA